MSRAIRISTSFTLALNLFGCATGGDPSSVELWELTREVSSNMETFQVWVNGAFKLKQSMGELNIPTGLCLKGIDLEVDVSDVTSSGGSVGLPLAAPGSPMSGFIGISGSQSETQRTNLVVPVAPVLPPPKDRKIVETEYKDFLKNWESSRRPPIPKRPAPPPGISEEEFSKRNDLAAELWRIREAMHYIVHATNRESNLLLRPTGLVFERKFTMVQQAGFDSRISMGSGAAISGQANSSRTGLNKMIITYAPNLSWDRMRCDAISISGPPRTTPPQEIMIVDRRSKIDGLAGDNPLSGSGGLSPVTGDTGSVRPFSTGSVRPFVMGGVRPFTMDSVWLFDFGLPRDPLLEGSLRQE